MYALAKASPDTLVIGLDVVHKQLVATSRRAGRWPERGGVPNLMLALARAQEPPSELLGRADESQVSLPWGDLLEGIALADAAVLDGLAALARPGARLRIVVNGAPWQSNAPIRMRRLPQVTPEYVLSTLVDPVRRSRHRHQGVETLDRRRDRRPALDVGQAIATGSRPPRTHSDRRSSALVTRSAVSAAAARREPRSRARSVQPRVNT